VRSSSRASSSSCTSSIAEEESEISETSDCVAAGGDVFLPPRPVTARKATQQQRHRGAEYAPQRKPVLKPSTAARRAQYPPKSPKMVTGEPPLSSTPGWRTRPQPDKKPATSEAGPLSAGSSGSQVPQSASTTSVTRSVFKVPTTPPVLSSQSRDAGSRIPRMVPASDSQSGADVATASRPATAVSNNAESGIPRAATPPPQRLQSSSSDMALSGSGSSTRTQSRIPTRTGSRRTQKDTAASSRGSSPGSVK